MTDFPIANMLRRGLPLVSVFGAEQPDQHNLRDKLSECAFFDVTTASQLYWQGSQNEYSLEDDFGPLRPPYPDMWLEWTVPKRVQIEGKWGERPALVYWAAHVASQPASAAHVTAESLRGHFEALARHNPEQVGFMPSEQDYADMTAAFSRSGYEAVRVTCTLLLCGPDGLIAPEPNAPQQPGIGVVPLTRQIDLDPATGRFIPKTALNFWPPTLTVEQQTNVTGLCDLNVVWIALQLINCRNVSTALRGSVFHRSGSEKRRGEPVVKYHTIVLPGMATTGGRGGRKSRRVDPLAMHKVRGHFKTFTAERPLLGRHVGTYWWGWQVRGSKDHGVVVSDYKVAAK